MHWVDPVTLERHYAALSCNRVKGRHTFQTIAENIQKLHMKFKVVSSAKHTVTDNGSNFVKCFKESKIRKLNREREMEDRAMLATCHMANTAEPDETILDFEDKCDDEVQLYAHPSVGDILDAKLKQSQVY